MASELQIIDQQQGEGKEAVAGKPVVVHYTGWLYDESAADNKGEKFDSSRDRNDPFMFNLGAGQVIKGWDQGVAGMKVGGQRRFQQPEGQMILHLRVRTQGLITGEAVWYAPRAEKNALVSLSRPHLPPDCHLISLHIQNSRQFARLAFGW